MKNVVFIILALNFTFAQDFTKTLEKNINHSGQSIEVKLSFANNIKFKTWDKKEVYIKADLAVEEEKYLDLYKLDIKESGSYLSVEEDTEALFKALQADRERKYGKSYRWKNMEYEFNYTVYVPNEAKVKLTSINGSLDSDNISGNFTADLINGDINIKNYNGDLDLNTINGEIDLKVINSTLVAETIHGDIFADENLNLTAEDQYVGQKVMSSSSKADNRLKLNTINGNMYLRK